MNPFSAIKQGLLAAGRNFDRNAAGDLPQIMGSDFNPDARRRARANAIMAIGQSLAGQKPLAEGLRGGQESMLQGWAAKQQIMQQRRAQEAAAAAQGVLSRNSAPAGVPTPEVLFARAQEYEQAAQISMSAGQLDKAKAYFGEAQNLRQRAAEMMPKNAGALQTVMGPDGKPTLLQPMTAGNPRPVEGGYGPMPNYTLVDTGGSVQLVDKTNPQATTFPKTMTPGERASTQLGQDRLAQTRTEFEKMYPIYSRNADSSAIQAGAASRNADTSAARLNYEQTLNPTGGSKLGEAAVDTIAQMRQGVAQLDSLGQSLEDKQAWLGLGGALAMVPGMGNIIQRFSATPASLEAEITMARQIIGKAMEGGVLRKEDEAKYAKMLPTIVDSLPVAKAKLNHVRRQLEANINTYLQTQQQYGRRTPGAALPPAAPPAVPNMPNITITPRAQ